MNMPYTPGYELIEITPDDFSEYMDRELILEVENPYNTFYAFSDCVSFTLSRGTGAYLRAVTESLVPCMLLLPVCFFGIFLFPTISFIFGKKNFGYLAFGSLCFFWGVYMISRILSWYMNIKIVDPVFCMMLDKITGYFFLASLLVYFRSNLKRDISRVISGAVTIGFLLVTITAVVLHITNICDLTAI